MVPLNVMFSVFYKCSENCGMGVRLQRYSPVFWSWIPKKDRMVPVRHFSFLPQRLVVKARYNEEACTICKEVVEVKIKYKKEGNKCPKCEVENSFLTLGEKCSLCEKGIVTEHEGLRIAF